MDPGDVQKLTIIVYFHHSDSIDINNPRAEIIESIQ